MRRHFEACRQEQARQFAPWGGGNQKAMIAACLSQVNYAAWERLLGVVSDNPLFADWQVEAIDIINAGMVKPR